MATLTGTTTRQITCTLEDSGPIVGGDQVRRVPAGTRVYVTPLKRGVRVRIPGTLYTQDVEADAVTAA